MVHLAYIDETYNKQRFWVVALVIPAEQAKSIEAGLDQLVIEMANRFDQVSPSAELHGYELSGGSGDWEPLHAMPKARFDLYQRAIELICESPGVYVIRGGVDLTKVGWGEHNDPHDWALRFLVEKIDRTFTPPVMAICDDVGQKDKYRKSFSAYKRNGTGGNRPCYLESFVDALHYVPSHYSRLVQAVDLVAYAYRRATFEKPRHPRPAAFFASQWERLERDLEHRTRLWPLS